VDLIEVMPPEDTHALKDDENCPVLTE